MIVASKRVAFKKFEIKVESFEDKPSKTHQTAQLKTLEQAEFEYLVDLESYGPTNTTQYEKIQLYNNLNFRNIFTGTDLSFKHRCEMIKWLQNTSKVLTVNSLTCEISTHMLDLYLLKKW